MKADASAYAVLGLRPGSGPVAIEAAYRRLIKRYHPDRRGGDAARAAEINWAYQELRRKFGDDLGRRRGPPAVRPSDAPTRRATRWWPALAAAAAALLLVRQDAVGDTFQGLAKPAIQPSRADFNVRPSVRAPRQDLSQVPLDSDGIDRSILDAVRIAANGSEERLADQSRLCHRQLRRDPSPSRLDRCVAFDEAVVALLARNMLEETGPFGFSSVTARQLSAGSLLSDDSLDVESRLARIRSHVELSLAPVEPPPVRRPT